MKHYETREENLSAIGKAYIDLKNNEAIGLMIVLRDTNKDQKFLGEIISFGLNDIECIALLARAADVMSDFPE